MLRVFSGVAAVCPAIVGSLALSGLAVRTASAQDVVTLAQAVRLGAICYLDEVVEARKDTTVVIHPLCDDRRILPIDKRGELLQVPPEFCLVISYNPGYQSVLKDLKQSTRQRFVALEFGYPEAALEQRIVEVEGQVSAETSPTFLVHARDDDVAKVENSVFYAEALRRAGVAHKFLLYEKAGHGFGLGLGTAPASPRC